LALEHEDLVAEREQLDFQVRATANDVTCCGEKGDDNSSHRSILAP
jgi:hypothetical protein